MDACARMHFEGTPQHRRTVPPYHALCVRGLAPLSKARRQWHFILAPEGSRRPLCRRSCRPCLLSNTLQDHLGFSPVRLSPCKLALEVHLQPLTVQEDGRLHAGFYSFAAACSRLKHSGCCTVLPTWHLWRTPLVQSVRILSFAQRRHNGPSVVFSIRAWAAAVACAACGGATGVQNAPRCVFAAARCAHDEVASHAQRVRMDSGGSLYSRGREGGNKPLADDFLGGVVAHGTAGLWQGQTRITSIGTAQDSWRYGPLAPWTRGVLSVIIGCLGSVTTLALGRAERGRLG